MVVKKMKSLSAHSYFQMSPQAGSGGPSRILKSLDHPESFLSLNSFLSHKSRPSAPTIAINVSKMSKQKEGAQKVLCCCCWVKVP